ncbi:DUF3501 family protein [Thiolapillus brandeum]|uniref:DUF3501 family protein n=1 Tax=Thiolapillus brandeum TaxID=1076588 RepID=A0A7U6GK55_9GAMM|nr:DUF3501 family protein [Thiolapillus brandeum]BAO45136.1 conserved hypothetical protein [Thiolapillus brandeum]
MSKLKREDLMSLEEYDQARPGFREQVMAHKKNRLVRLDEHAALYFEDRLTMQYQIQEMLRIEKIFDAAGIQEELDTYNPLIPDGSNWKATFMIEYPDVEERKEMLARLKGIEDKVWVRVGDLEKVYPISNEDLERTTEEKTSSVHFMRFELTDEMVEAAKQGADISMGIDHAEFNVTLSPIPAVTAASLRNDLH